MDSRRCQDCNCELNEGEALTFTVCDACWDKHYKTKKQDSQSESATNVSYASPALSGVQNGGQFDVLEEAVKKEMEMIIANRDKFLKAFIAETGLHPSECIMVEQKINTPTYIGTQIFFEKRNKS